jgi:hypothetical protein
LQHVSCNDIQSVAIALGIHCNYNHCNNIPRDSYNSRNKGVLTLWAMDLRWPPRSSLGMGAGVDRPCHQGSPPVKGFHRGCERDADAFHGVAHLAAAALPIVTSASEVVSAAQIQPSGLHVLCRRPFHGQHRPWGRRSGHPMDLGTHGGVFSLATEGRHPVDLVAKTSHIQT